MCRYDAVIGKLICQIRFLFIAMTCMVPNKSHVNKMSPIHNPQKHWKFVKGGVSFVSATNYVNEF